MGKIFNKFKEKFYEDLNETIHPESSYHKEGSVWTHTMLVFNEALKNSDNKIFHIAALLHDIGKKEARIEKNGKIMFQGHEGISTLKSINFLKELEKEGLINKKELLDILYIINYHGSLWQKSEKQIKQYFTQDLYDKVYEFSLYDQGGNLTFEINRNNKPKIQVNSKQQQNYNSNNPTCYIMIGIPTSGKSTYIDKNFKNLEILSRDNIVMEYAKNKYKCSIYNDYNQVWFLLSEEDHNEVDKLLLKKFNELKRNRKSFVIDMTNTSWKSRRRWISQLKNYNVISKVFLIDLEENYKRDLNRKKEIGKYIKKEKLHFFAKKLELPLLEEGLNDIEYIFNDFTIKSNKNKKIR